MFQKPTSKIFLYGILVMSIFSFFSCKNFFWDNKNPSNAEKISIVPTFNLACTFNTETGFYENNHPEYMADFHFYPVQKGDKIVFDAKRYEYTFAFYTDEIEERFIHTYCYQEEENWTKYSGNLQKENWKTRDYTFKRPGWCRLSVRKKDKAALTEQDLDIIKSKVSLTDNGLDSVP